MATTREHWRVFGGKVALGAAIAIATTVATDLYQQFKRAAGALASGTGVPLLSGSPLSMSVKPTYRQATFHGFFFVGHWDYSVAYQVKITNDSATESRRIPMQFNSTAAYLAQVDFPPIVRPTQIGTSATGNWRDVAYSKRSQSLGFEIDQPSAHSEITISVLVVSPDAWPTDSDLSVQIMLPSNLISATGENVTWTK